MIRVTFRSMAQRRLRTALTAMAIVLGVAMVTAAFTVSDTMRAGADSLTSAAYDGTDAVVSAKSTIKRDEIDKEHDLIPASTVDRIRAAPGVQTAVGDVTQQAKIIDRHGDVVGDGPFFGIGLDAVTKGATQLTPFHLVGGTWAASGDQVVIDQGTAGKQHLSVGDSIRIAGRGPARDYRISGVARFGSVKSIGKATIAIFDLKTAQAVLGAPGAYDEILVKATPGTSPAALRKTLARMLGPDVAVTTAQANDRFTLDGLKQFVSIIKTILLIFGIVAIIVGGATILNAMSITVAQRSRELALLRSLGAARRQVRRSVRVEALFIGASASVVGIAVGYFLAKGLTSLLASMGLDLPNSGTSFAASTAIIAIIVGVGTTMVAAAIPARRAMRVSPIEAMREESAERGGIVRRSFRRVASGLVSVLGRP